MEPEEIYLQWRWAIYNQIELYDKYIIGKSIDFVKKYLKPLNLNFVRSIFIENCYIDVKQYDIRELIVKIKANLVYFHWWDVLTFDELIQSVINAHFLQSTQKLINIQSLVNYFNHKFNSKEDLINHILQNFYPSERSLEYMKVEVRGSLAFDYLWLFNNEFKRSIRYFTCQSILAK